MKTIQEICAGTDFPDVTRLDWLAALVTEYRQLRLTTPSEDPAAEAMMLEEVGGLLADLRAAYARREAKTRPLTCADMMPHRSDVVIRQGPDATPYVVTDPWKFEGLSNYVYVSRADGGPIVTPEVTP